jgi:phosphotransferase system enzyme I (PtsI)
MPPVRELRGEPASDGVFIGPLTRLDGNAERRKHSGSIESERQALDQAVARSIAEITALTESSRGEAADMLAFQVAMLEDEALIGPALDGITMETAADVAWRDALDAEIAGYRSSEDDYFRARSVDLKDIRDRVLRHLNGGGTSKRPSCCVLYCEDIAPTAFLETDWSRGGAIALTGGSASSHVAMLARARGVPMVVGVNGATLAECKEAIVDGASGLVILDPDSETRRRYAESGAMIARRRKAEAEFLLHDAKLKDGTPIETMINVASLAELENVDPRSCHGIGLMRSEFLFRDGAPLPSEHDQYAAYRGFLEWADGRPVTVRTLDIGGDKPIAGLTPPGEKNPFLGLRGVRLTLARPDVFRAQLRALARAAPHGKLKVMLPMVTVPDELARASALLDECVGELKREGIDCAKPHLGIMIEVPATALAPELFADAAFFSIGSNDLTQYVTAASRDEVSVAKLNDPTHPAVRKLIAAVARFGKEHGIPVSLCGDMASEPAHLRTLIDAGIVSLSVAPARLARVKAALAEL